MEALVTWSILFSLGLWSASAANMWVDPVSNIEAAMTGFDPIMSNPYKRPDPGMRNKIFEPVKLSERVFGKFDLNSFVDKAQEDTFCDLEFVSKTVRNLNEYNDVKKSSYSFASGASESYHHFSYSSNSGQGQAGSDDEASVQNFFESTEGEIVMAQAQCIVYSTSISHFEKPVFTEGFISALRGLNKAALSSHDDDVTFIEFLYDYGTHFMKNVQMGARLVFVKGFSSRATSEMEAEKRSQCVSDAAYDSSGKDRMFKGHENSFADMSRNCSGDSTGSANYDSNAVQIEEAIFLGPLPTRTFAYWAEDAIARPVPISFQLEKISSLFRDDWINDIPADDKDPTGETLNATAIYTYFEDKSYMYCEIMLGEECKNSTGCGFSNICPSGTVCVEDEASSFGYQCLPTYGGAIFAGGYNPAPLGTVESLGTYELPDLPQKVFNTSMAVIGSKIYLAGGIFYNVSSSTVYELDLSDAAPAWTSNLVLPVSVNSHRMVAVSNHLWVTYSNTLYDIDTTTNRIMTYYTPFSVSNDHCAVSNATHSYVLGVGSGYDEIWVNSEPLKPATWHKVQKLSGAWRGFGCLWFKNQIFVSGGREPMLNNVAVFDLTTNEVSALDILRTGRQEHEMFVLEGKPAVAGGCDDACTTFFNTIETYDTTLKNWTVDARYLRQTKSAFGLAQLPQ